MSARSARIPKNPEMYLLRCLPHANYPRVAERWRIHLTVGVRQGEPKWNIVKSWTCIKMVGKPRERRRNWKRKTVWWCDVLWRCKESKNKHTDSECVWMLRAVRLVRMLWTSSCDWRACLKVWCSRQQWQLMTIAIDKMWKVKVSRYHRYHHITVWPIVVSVYITWCECVTMCNCKC